ncbi:hypothetical protein ACLOJK_006748 [Asimina triloba]
MARALGLKSRPPQRRSNFRRHTQPDDHFDMVAQRSLIGRPSPPTTSLRKGGNPVASTLVVALTTPTRSPRRSCANLMQRDLADKATRKNLVGTKGETLVVSFAKVLMMNVVRIEDADHIGNACCGLGIDALGPCWANAVRLVLSEFDTCQVRRIANGYNSVVLIWCPCG